MTHPTNPLGDFYTRLTSQAPPVTDIPPDDAVIGTHCAPRTRLRLTKDQLNALAQNWGALPKMMLRKIKVFDRWGYTPDLTYAQLCDGLRDARAVRDKIWDNDGFAFSPQTGEYYKRAQSAVSKFWEYTNKKDCSTYAVFHTHLPIIRDPKLLHKVFKGTLTRLENRAQEYLEWHERNPGLDEEFGTCMRVHLAQKWLADVRDCRARLEHALKHDPYVMAWARVREQRRLCIGTQIPDPTPPPLTDAELKERADLEATYARNDWKWRGRVRAEPPAPKPKASLTGRAYFAVRRDENGGVVEVQERHWELWRQKKHGKPHETERV
jgi:hypothetical protein